MADAVLFSKSREAYIQRLIDGFQRGEREALPDVLRFLDINAAVWTSGAVAKWHSYVRCENRYYWVTYSNSAGVNTGNLTNSPGNGVFGVTMPTSTDEYVVDSGNQVVMTFMGYRAPLARANNLLVYPRDILFVSGRMYEVMTGGALASSDPGTYGGAAAVTDGSAVLRDIGAQDRPLATMDATDRSSVLTQARIWSHADIVVQGATGVPVNGTSNLRGVFVAGNGDGAGAYTQSDSGVGASLFFSFSGDEAQFSHYGTGGSGHIIEDGRYVCTFLANPSSAQGHYVHILNSPRLKRLRTYRVFANSTVQFINFNFGVIDTVQKYIPPDDMVTVIFADSQGEGGAQGGSINGYTQRYVLRSGMPNTRLSAIGGTAMRNPGPWCSYITRISDAMNYAPQRVIVQVSQNDTNTTAGYGTTWNMADILASYETFIQQIRSLPTSPIIEFWSCWPGSGGLGEPNITMNAGVRALADAYGCLWVDRSSFFYSLGAGHAGNLQGVGPSGHRLTGDNVHFTPLYGRDTCELITQRSLAALRAAA